MQKVALDDVRPEPNPLGVHETRKPLSKVLKTSDFAMVYYELEPGESFSGGMHAHHDQEEVFFVQEGTATFETTDDAGEERESVTVEAGEAVRFERGEFQVGRNESDEAVRALAFGAPDSQHDFGEIDALMDCPECGEETVHEMDLVDGRFAFECEQCGREF